MHQVRSSFSLAYSSRNLWNFVAQFTVCEAEKLFTLYKRAAKKRETMGSDAGQGSKKSGFDKKDSRKRTSGVGIEFFASKSKKSKP